MKTRIRSILSPLSIVIHFIFFRISVFGNNQFQVGAKSFFWNSKIRVKGSYNYIKLGGNVGFKRTMLSINGNNNRVIFSNNVKVFELLNILIEGDNCEIYTGPNTTIGSADIFCGEGNTKIFIGADCMFGRQVSMNTSDFHSIVNVNNNARINPPKNIFIGDHVWLGFGTTIKKGAKVNGDTIVASGAIVGSKEYPANTILGGIPAKIIKENITWNREKLPY